MQLTFAYNQKYNFVQAVLIITVVNVYFLSIICLLQLALTDLVNIVSECMFLGMMSNKMCIILTFSQPSMHPII